MCQPNKPHDGEAPGDGGSDRPSPRKYAANLSNPMPLGRKMHFIAKNMWLRVAKLQPCCGHPGQPGC